MLVFDYFIYGSIIKAIIQVGSVETTMNYLGLVLISIVTARIYYSNLSIFYPMSLWLMTYSYFFKNRLNEGLENLQFVKAY